MELIRMSIKDNENGTISNELKIAVGAMEIADKTVQNVMTKLSDVFMLPDTTVLNAKAVAEIVKMGYTRIPVYSGGDKNNVTDLLFVKVGGTTETVTVTVFRIWRCSIQKTILL